MNVALILAGGSGKRTEQDVPKQFINVFDKPIIIYTLEAFQKHPDIDGIIVSCLEGWEEILRAYAREYGITKLKWVVTGGENGQASARIALYELEKVCTEDDIVLIHDGVRPMLGGDIISDCIVTCRRYGNALSAIRCQETVVGTEDGISGDVSIHRNTIMRVMTPQAYRFGRVLWGHKEALKRGITNAVYTNTLMLELGERVYFSTGSAKNLKLTTLEDIEIFKALYSAEREDWIK